MKRTAVIRRTLILASFLALAVPLAAGPTSAADVPLRNDPAVDSAIRLLESWITARMEYDRIPGLSIAVVLDQRIVWSRGFGLADVEGRVPASPRTIYRAASITKLFTATSLVQLRDAGKLRFDDPVSKYLPWFKPVNPFPDAPPITIWDLLTHTSGLPGEAAFPYWTDHVFPTREEIMKALPSQTLVYPPKTKYKYSNLGLALAGEVVAAVSGESWDGYVKKHILDPLGMTDTSASLPESRMGKLAFGYSRLLPDGRRTVLPVVDYKGMSPAANLTTTVEDLARFMMLQFRDDQASKRPVLTGTSLREMQRVQWMFPSWTGGRGIGFIIRRSGDKTIVGHGGWVGGYRSQLGFVPADRLGIVVMINCDDGTPNVYLDRALALLGPALRLAAPHPAAEPKTDPAWKGYVGLYTDATFWDNEVLVLDGKLVIYGHGYPPEDDPLDTIIELQPVSGHVFRSAGPNGDGELVSFEMDGQGKVKRIKVGENYLFPKR